MTIFSVSGFDDFGKMLLDRCGPYETVGVLIVTVQIVFDNGDHSRTFSKLPHRMRLSVRSRNQRSTKSNQELDAGMKYRWNRGYRWSQDCTRGCLFVPQLPSSLEIKLPHGEGFDVPHSS